MDLTQAVILGAVQGLTEFLPISSSGHLILARDVLGLNVPSGLAVDAVLQLATAFAVLVYFRKTFLGLLLSLLRWASRRAIPPEDRTLILALILGTIPGVILGLVLEGTMETAFRSAELVALSLLAGSLLFYVAERCARQREQLSAKKGLWIGFFQALALIPGVSRSGATISGGLLLGLTRENAARFGFLLSFPIIAGSGCRKLFELVGSGYASSFGSELFVGALVAFVVGVAVIHWLLQYLRTHTLGVFIWYRVALALVVLVFVSGA